MHSESNSLNSQASQRQPAARRWGRFGICCALIAVIWLGLLPALSNRPNVEKRIRFLESRGIDASAMFYTELEAMDGVLERLDRFHRRHPQALWRPSATTGRDAAN